MMISKMKQFIADTLSTGFFIGMLPFAPGTFGSLIAIPFGYLGTFFNMWGKIILFLSVFFIGIISSQIYIDNKGTKDPSSVVIDEVTGLLLFYLLFPFKPFYILTGFILFRFFDIFKPFPIKIVESISGAWGVMLDDIVAGIYAIILCWIVTYIIGIF